jgi:hypothetical protein
MYIGVGVAQSVYCLTPGWMTAVRSLAKANNFFCCLLAQTSSEPYPASYPVGTGGPFPGVKHGWGINADHLLSSSAEVKNE